MYKCKFCDNYQTAFPKTFAEHMQDYHPEEVRESSTASIIEDIATFVVVEEILDSIDTVDQESESDAPSKSEEPDTSFESGGGDFGGGGSSDTW